MIIFGCLLCFYVKRKEKIETQRIFLCKQRQLIALARAAVADPRAMILDEAADIESLEDRKALIWAFINSVYLYDDDGGYAIINFIYKHHAKKVCLEDVGKSDAKPVLILDGNSNPVHLIGDCFSIKVMFPNYYRNMS